MKVNTLVIGAGISGLSFALNCKTKNLLVVEKESTPGGYCRSIKNHSFVWDYSGHYLHFRNPETQRIVQQWTPEIIKKRRDSHVLLNGSSICAPYQENIYQLPINSFFRSLFSYYTRPRSVASSFKEKTIASVGKAIADDFLIPYNEKLYNCDLNKLSPDAMGHFLPQNSFLSPIRGLLPFNSMHYNSDFYYYSEGMQTLIDAVHSMLICKVSCNEKVLSVNIERKVATTTTREISYNNLISTISLNQFLPMIVDAVPVSTGPLLYNKVVVFNLGFNSSSSFPGHWYYIPDPNISFYRVGFYNNVKGRKQMNLYVEVSINQHDHIDLITLRSKVLEDLKLLGFISDHSLIAESVVVMDPGYVHILSEQVPKIRSLHKQLNKYDVYLLGRYANWEYSSIENSLNESLSLSKNITV